ncbi:MAG: ARPP-1 family domain-containing protein [Candidatus Hermodarchaeota archaeon]
MTDVKVLKKFAKQVVSMDGMEIGNPIVLEEISFVPIIKQQIPIEDRDYLTLSEALEQEVCKIIDKGTEVAHIVFENLGDLPILVEEGEIFKGAGTQDRISVGTVMVQPRDVIEIAVKCVHAPHHLSAGANFMYGGKAGRGMLNEIRTLKIANAQMNAPASTIDQSRVWNKVSEEMEFESNVSDTTQYSQGVKERSKRAKKRSEKVKFPNNTVGFIAIDSEGEIKGIEIHRSPHNFNIRKEGIFESLEANVSWDSKGKGPYKKSEEKVKGIFEKLANIEEGKDALHQVEVEGIVINMDDLSGEAFTNAFYSSVCPYCNKPKPRKKECPHCGSEEDDSEELTYMSLY